MSFNIATRWHLKGCTEREAYICVCRVYLVTAAGALLASGVSITIGWDHSLALLSEAPHGLVDALSDVIAFGLFAWYHRDVDEGRWHWLLAAVLVIAAGSIAYEGYERLQLENYPFSGAWAFLATGIVLTIHYVRLWVLRKDKGVPTKIRNGVIRHVIADIWHAKAVLIVAAAVSLIQTLEFPLPFQIKWIDLSLTGVLVIYMLWQSWKIAMGHGCGHDHTAGEGLHEHGDEPCDHSHT